MATLEHRNITPAQRHAPHSWVVANAAARTALTVVSADVNKYCRQQDDNSQWMLINDSPVTWLKFNGGTVAAADITDSTTVGRAVLTAANAAAARTAIGAGTGNGSSNFSGAYADLSGKPTLGTAAALNVAASGNAAAGEVVKGDDTRLAAGLTNPMTTAGDLIRGGASGSPTRVAIGTTGQVLTVAAGVPAWATPASSGMTNPMTTAGDMIIGGTSGTPTRVGVSTNGYVWTLVAGVPAWAAASGGGGLTGFTSALATASPNNTVNASQFLASGGSVDQDVVIQPKGTGALLAQLPDGTATGGDKRGTNGVDFQMRRASSGQVASGTYSTILSGYNNTASGPNSAVIAGRDNSASGNLSSIVSGFNNSNSGAASIVCAGGSNLVTTAYSGIVSGASNSVSAGYAFIGAGVGNTASGDNSSILGGSQNTASGANSAAFGRDAHTRGIYGAMAYGSGRFSAAGDAQSRSFILRAATTNATATRLTTDQGSPSSVNEVNLPTAGAIRFIAHVVARNTSTGTCASWVVNGLVKNVSGTVSLVGTPTAVKDFSDSGASTWELSVSVDATNKTVTFSVAGQASTSINTVVSAQTVESLS